MLPKFHSTSFCHIAIKRFCFFFQLENCGRPAIITKDLSMVIYGRDARTGPRSFKHLFSGNYRNVEANRLSGVYELLLRRASEAGSPGRFPFSIHIPALFPILWNI